ncbi:Uncharacterised protein [Yersinia intermedia]|nr:Uncharacterised protein [Yersinia intermedia]VDZ50633.1 Uncharacterised protein [Yersinia intermedia]
MELKNSISEYTELEFLVFLKNFGRRCFREGT